MSRYIVPVLVSNWVASSSWVKVTKNAPWPCCYGFWSLHCDICTDTEGVNVTCVSATRKDLYLHSVTNWKNSNKYDISTTEFQYLSRLLGWFHWIWSYRKVLADVKRSWDRIIWLSNFSKLAVTELKHMKWENAVSFHIKPEEEIHVCIYSQFAPNNELNNL